MTILLKVWPFWLGHLSPEIPDFSSVGHPKTYGSSKSQRLISPGGQLTSEVVLLLISFNLAEIRLRLAAQAIECLPMHSRC